MVIATGQILKHCVTEEREKEPQSKNILISFLLFEKLNMDLGDKGGSL